MIQVYRRCSPFMLKSFMRSRECESLMIFNIFAMTVIQLSYSSGMNGSDCICNTPKSLKSPCPSKYYYSSSVSQLSSLLGSAIIYSGYSLLSYSFYCLLDPVMRPIILFNRELDTFSSCTTMIFSITSTLCDSLTSEFIFLPKRT